MLNLAEFEGEPPSEQVASYQKALSTALDLIKLYDLHAQPDQPVDLGGLLASFDVRFMELPARTQGFTLDMEDKIIIALNEKLTPPQTRFVAAHEIGHVALWHKNQLNACLKGEWLYNRMEIEASSVAAFLLLPAWVVADGLLDETGHSKVEEIASQFIVPNELVLIRRALYAQTGY